MVAQEVMAEAAGIQVAVARAETGAGRGMVAEMTAATGAGMVTLRVATATWAVMVVMKVMMAAVKVALGMADSSRRDGCYRRNPLQRSSDRRA